MMIVLIVLVALLGITTYIFMKRPQFGALPEGTRLAAIQSSPHFKDGRFRNRVEMPIITAGYSMTGEIYKPLFRSFPDREPVNPLPSVKTDLLAAPRDSDMIVWFGHSSFYLQLGGVRFLADPIFSGKASPLPGGVRAYKGSDIYTAADIPEIDYMLLSHDHYDHLDYETAVALKDKVNPNRLLKKTGTSSWRSSPVSRSSPPPPTTIQDVDSRGGKASGSAFTSAPRI
ncbi:MBL fold metallo-hydrolase [Chitinophaga sp.]|uniref:MBL fold metallo-hydrolase n=1 Tax=Chitinophaga sp. TaxID=1869181 RepID=UPI002FDEA566